MQKSENLTPRLFANETMHIFLDWSILIITQHSSLRAHAQFTTLYCCSIVFLQHGGVYYCRQNDVSVAHVLLWRKKTSWLPGGL